eukprot:gene8908-9087_t
MATPTQADRILTYWFGADYAQQMPPGSWTSDSTVTDRWFKGGAEVDQYIKDHFTRDVEALAAGQYDNWLQQPCSALAGIVLADQFTRNIYRGSARAFSLDHVAIAWSRHVQDSGMAKQLADPLRYFSMMPFMHSEQLEDQQRCVDLSTAEYEANKALDPDSPATRQWASVVKFAQAHRDVVAKWGRFPHRNTLLGRCSTPEEEAGLADGSIGRW